MSAQCRNPWVLSWEGTRKLPSGRNSGASKRKGFGSIQAGGIREHPSGRNSEAPKSIRKQYNALSWGCQKGFGRSQIPSAWVLPNASRLDTPEYLPLQDQNCQKAETFIKNLCFVPAPAPASDSKCTKMLKKLLKIDVLSQSQPQLQSQNIAKC